jgi:hypothetical protein
MSSHGLVRLFKHSHPGILFDGERLSVLTLWQPLCRKIKREPVEGKKINKDVGNSVGLYLLEEKQGVFSIVRKGVSRIAYGKRDRS